MREVLQGAAEQCDFPRSELRFRALMEAFPAAAYTCDTDGYITYFNRRSIALWGRAPKLHHADDRYCGSFRLYSPDGTPVPHDQCWMALALRDGKEYNGHEIMIERPDGSRWTALAHANPIYDETGEIAGAVNVLVDITDRKEAENLLREADRNKNEFLAMLAHELRNPLAPIRTGLKTIQLAGTNSTIAEEARKMMERQLEHMVRLIDDLLDLSRITRRKIELRRTRISLQDVMQDAVETSRPFIEASGHRLTVTPPTRPVIVNADRVRLSQVIVNLLHNSAKYTEAGGHIELTVERQGTDAVIKVRDNGIGVSADMLPKIFDIFAQGHQTAERTQGGLGIGLSLVRGLVEMHGGRVEAYSEGPGKGSEFIVRLSVVGTALHEPLAADEDDAAASNSSKYRVLIVDDNEDSATSLSMMLKIMGHDTRAAHDGLQALDVADAFRPELILLDIGLPKLNGYEVCRRLRERPWGGEVVLIAVTGWGQDEDKRQSKEAGFNFHLVKPIDPDALEKLMSGLLLTPM